MSRTASIQARLGLFAFFPLPSTWVMFNTTVLYCILPGDINRLTASLLSHSSNQRWTRVTPNRWQLPSSHNHRSCARTTNQDKSIQIKNAQTPISPWGIAEAPKRCGKGKRSSASICGGYHRARFGLRGFQRLPIVYATSTKVGHHSSVQKSFHSRAAAASAIKIRTDWNTPIWFIILCNRKCILKG